MVIAAGSEERVDLIMGGQEALACRGDLKRPLIFSRFRVGLWLPSILLFKPLCAR